MAKKRFWAVWLGAAVVGACAGTPMVEPVPPGAVLASSARPADPEPVAPVTPSPEPAVIAPPGAEATPASTLADAEPQRQFKWPVVPREDTRVLVLMYHNFTLGRSQFDTWPNVFAKQAEWLAENVDVISMSDLIDFLDGEIDLPERAAVITIDDGLRTAYTRAFPILREHKLPFALALPTGVMEEWRSKQTLEWDEIREMIDSGLCEIASHSVTHADFRKLSDHHAKREMHHSRKIIEQRIGIRPRAFVYPLGSHDGRVRYLVEETGYEAGFGVSTRPRNFVHAKTKRYSIPRQSIDFGTSLRRLAAHFGFGPNIPPHEQPKHERPPPPSVATSVPVQTLGNASLTKKHKRRSRACRYPPATTGGPAVPQ